MMCVYVFVWLDQLNVHRCNECGQPLPEDFEPPADEPWTTGIFGCTEDTESCKFTTDPSTEDFVCVSVACLFSCEIGIRLLCLFCLLMVNSLD